MPNHDGKVAKANGIPGTDYDVWMLRQLIRRPNCPARIALRALELILLVKGALPAVPVRSSGVVGMGARRKKGEPLCHNTKADEALVTKALKQLLAEDASTPKEP